MENRKKYKILWLNNELRVDLCNPMFQLLDTLRNEAESKYENLSIQTCVWGNDFLEFAKDQSQKWNAFVIDPYGKMAEGSRTTIGKHLINDYGFKDLVQKFEVLMYCFTKDTNEGLDENDNLVHHLDGIYQFAKFDDGSCCCNYSENAEVGEIHLFKHVIETIEEKGRLFIDYPAIEEIYDEIKRDKGGKCEATNTILDLLRWKQGQIGVDFETGIRSVMQHIGNKLVCLGFFNHPKASKKPGDPKFNSVSGFYIDINAQDPVTEAYMFSSNCRLKWEASAMHYLGYFADVAHHDIQKDEGNDDDYNRYKGMIFDAFVLYSKWYVRFKQCCMQNQGNPNWMFDLDYGKQDLQFAVNKQYFNGTLQRDSLTNKWLISIPYYILGSGKIIGKITKSKKWHVDYNEVNKNKDIDNTNIGKRVSFYLNAQGFAESIKLY